MQPDTHTLNDRLLRKSEVAQVLACSTKTVEREVQDGHLTRVKIRGGVRFLQSEVNQLINQKRI